MYLKFLFLFLFFTTVYAEDEASKDESEITTDIYKALESVADKHNIDMNSIISLVQDISFDQNSFGCGTGDSLKLASGQYITNIQTGNQRSSMTYPTSEDEQWNGKGVDTPELLILEQGKVKAAIELNVHRKELEFVLFEPKKIIFFQWGDINGSYHTRSCFTPAK